MARKVWVLRRDDGKFWAGSKFAALEEAFTFSRRCAAADARSTDESVVEAMRTLRLAKPKKGAK